MSTQTSDNGLSLDALETASAATKLITSFEDNAMTYEKDPVQTIQEVTETQNFDESDSDFDLESIRLPQHYSEQIGVKKLLTTVPVRKPNRTQFCRTHPEYRMDVKLLKYGETDEMYVVKPEVSADVLQLAKPYRLVLVVDRLGTAFIWPLAIPDEERPMDWHKSALEADLRAQKAWIRLAANQALGAYDIFEAAGELSEPIWPTESWNKLVEVAFKQKIIDTPEHVIIQKLQGRM